MGKLNSAVGRHRETIKPMLPTSKTDLTEDEFDELEQFLNHDSGLVTPMSISEIDGLLTAEINGVRLD